MRYQGWLVLIAGLVTVPQAALCAGAWSETSPYGGWQAPGYQVPTSARFRPLGRNSDRAVVPRAAAPDPRLSVAGYRFRPWDTQAHDQSRSPGGFPHQAPAVTYRGQQPGWQPAPPVAAHGMTRAPMAYPGNRAFRTANAYPVPGYRFRPLQAKRPVRDMSAPRYRPVQVRIPNRYVFRPLNPVARPAPHRPVTASPRQPPVYASPSYMYWPGYAYSPALQGSRGTHPVFPYAVSRGYAPGVESFDPRWIKGYPSYPMAYTPGINRMPGYRSRFRPELAAKAPANRAYHFRRYPHQRRYAAGPAYVWRRDRGRYAGYQTPYANGERAAYLPPVSPSRVNRYGMDWYDGRGDGEGAWYRLILDSAPAISQSQEPWAVSPHEQEN